MSGAVSGSYGTIATLMRNVSDLNAKNTSLTAEVSTGVVSGNLAGLGDQAYGAINLGPQISAIGAWQNNVSALQTRLTVTQGALSGISTIASNLQSSLSSLSLSGTTDTVAIASQAAKQALTQLTSLLNTQSGNQYVFAGTASDQPPVSGGDLAASGLVGGIMQAVAQVGSAGAAATQATTLASASDNSPANSVFSAQLATSATAASGLVSQVPVGQGLSLAAGVVATQGGSATAQSTGSPIRDLIRALATVAGLSGADASSSGFSQLVSDTQAALQGTSTGIQNLVSQVGLAQSGANAQGSTLSDLNTALQSQFGSIMNADLASVRSQQVAVQTQLTASYTLIADLKTLSLTHYL